MDIKTSLLEFLMWHNVGSHFFLSLQHQLFHPLLSLQEKSLGTGTSLHTTMWFSLVLFVPSTNPHNSSSSILPVLHNLLFWDLLISKSIMRLDPKPIQEGLLKWSSEKGMKTMLITSETGEREANHQLLFFFLLLFGYCYCCHNLLQALASKSLWWRTKSRTT